MQYVPKPQLSPGPISHLGFALASREEVDAVAAEAKKAGLLKFGPTFLNLFAGYLCVMTGTVCGKQQRKETGTVHRFAPPPERRITPRQLLRLSRQASPGIDGVMWQEYETGLEDRLTVAI